MYNFKIPNLMPMYEAVSDFVSTHQGKSGFIRTQDTRCDTIWVMLFEDYDYSYIENEMKAIRVKNGVLECIHDRPYIDWSPQAIAAASDEEWCSIMYDDEIYFLPTIFNIAENINQYVYDSTGQGADGGSAES